ncbi:RagB/SusD family nutrient uptake outer membrane protein [Flavobacterium granuli]|uniref:Outer membrane starch-binding protein n=1 Tax=Flavobacterium granuli TaxID=280093 RepID=A0A1M5J6Y7_9FLAO|nr:RagB/SusD family nutrient uptake outer membrane protein [Flavobacterium granuli]PRZ28244.1 putative outer membrane starch-binding protein [Flavobacterium granuli]SHG35773.1 Starch-binding associating with outer membrane [Flavobacterium granuli]
MNKKVLKLAILVCFAPLMGLVSCSNEFTNLDPKGSTSNVNFWKTEQDAVEAVNSIYFYMKDEDMFARGYFWYINASDDMVTGRINSQADNIKSFKIKGTEGYTSWMYPQSYKVIRRANDVLRHVPKMNVEQKLKNRLLGEAYFMRAFHYFWLAHTYGDNGSNGGVPIITEANMDEPAGSFKRPKSVADNYAQIVEDLTKAAELLPLYTEYSSANLGRAHKDAALAYIAKTYLYWAQFDNTKYAEAVKYCDAVTNSGSGRALIDTNNPQQDYRLLHSHLNNWTSEYIWSVDSGVEGGSKLPGVMLENKGWGKYNGWGYYTPTESLYQEFEANDVRRGVTILNFGDEFGYFGAKKKYQSENSLSGFQFNKYMYEYQFENPIGVYINSNGDAPTTVYNVPLMRYAEILLIKSEALIMQGKNGDAPLNQVRDRAGLPAVTNATMVNLKHERRVELAGEFANRHFDLVRWGDAQEVYSKPLYGRIHTDRSNPDSPYNLKVVWPARNFNPNHMNVWPIPTSVITSSGIPQNVGW